MRLRWLASLGVALVLAALGRGGPLPCGVCKGVQAGHLVLPEEGTRHFQVIPYFPQAGDVLLFDDEDPIYRLMFKAAGTGPPDHVAIVFAREDGLPALLDLTGPTVKSAKVSLLDVLPRLQKYHGVITVRRPRQQLTPQQSAELRHFAQEQQGKEFAYGRMLLQGTPFRCRIGLRHYLFAGTCMDRSRWLCSELVVAAATSAHVLDAKRFPANSMYPRDLAYDEKYDLSGIYHAPILWVPDPQPPIRGSVVDVFLK